MGQTEKILVISYFISTFSTCCKLPKMAAQPKIIFTGCTNLGFAPSSAGITEVGVDCVYTWVITLKIKSPYSGLQKRKRNLLNRVCELGKSHVHNMSCNMEFLFRQYKHLEHYSQFLYRYSLTIMREM